MSRVSGDLEALVKCRYRFPKETALDVQTVTATYQDLHPYVNFYYYTNRDRKRLLNLSGTIPVLYEGVLYNIPVSIWLHETHPQNPPKCFVRPSVTMVINTKSSSVDATGLVSLPCLSNWKPGISNLSVVIAEMRAAFQRETPLFCTLAQTTKTPPLVQHPQSPLHTGNGISQSSPDPHIQYFPDARLPSISSASSQNLVAFSPNMATFSPAGPARTQVSSAIAPSDGPGVRRSHAEGLLDLGVAFRENRSRTPSPSNPFLQSSSDSNTNVSTPEGVEKLLKSLHLGNVADADQSNTSNTGVFSPSEESCGDTSSLAGHQLLVDDRHRIEVTQLPQGIPSRKMKNKLTIYFQRQHNGGGEVLDVQYPSAQPDRACITFSNQRDAEQVLKHAERLFTVNKEHFPIQVKKVDGLPAPVAGGISREKEDMFWSLLSMKEHRFSPEDVLEAVQSCQDFPSALRYLSHECPICREQVSFSKIITMTHCSCAFCESCFKAYFSSVIKEKSIMSVVCPICNKPEVRGASRMEEAMDYFNLLDTQIRHYLDKETHELFQRKLRDHALQEMPNFRWCAHCSFGVLHEADRLRMDCPNCGKSTCFRCRSPWAAQHEGLSCENFKEWELCSNPENQARHLENLLNRNRIDCPKCKFRFHLSKGGCLHFKCTQCQHNFCGGCGRPFSLGSACDFSVECGARGLHAHHPRDCLYHLRDWSVSRLQNLLQCCRVSYSLQPQGAGPQGQKDCRGVCPVLEFREAHGLQEEPCGQPAPPEYGGYCMQHYKEYLVELINKNRLDPVELFDRAEMEAELQRWRVPIPAARPKEDHAAYLRRLRQVGRDPTTFSVSFRSDWFGTHFVWRKLGLHPPHPHLPWGPPGPQHRTTQRAGFLQSRTFSCYSTEE